MENGNIQYAVGAVLLTGLLNAGAQFQAGKKAKVTGTIQSRNGIWPRSGKKTGASERLAMLVLHDDAQREYA